jgi:hypothetical protein
MADDPRHEHIAHPLADERSHGDERVRAIRVANEGDASEASDSVLASFAAFHERGALEAAHRTEGGRISIVTAHFSAGDFDFLVRAVTRVERETFHRVEVYVKARQPARIRIVQPPNARDYACRARDDGTARIEAREVPLYGGYEFRSRTEMLAGRSPALIGVPGRTRRTKGLRGV